MHDPGQPARHSRTVLSLDPEVVGSLKDGINFKKSTDDGMWYIIYKDQQGELKACKNQCKHQGGLFIKDIEDLDGRTVRCTKHYWKLNVSTMCYVNPPESFTQDEFEVVMTDEGGLKLVEVIVHDPWLAEPRDLQKLQEGEMTVPWFCQPGVMDNHLDKLQTTFICHHNFCVEQ
ncbi:hypothetical protein UPYG_G00349290 [Umbra pygmaea]|uniref:Rieske domain-containing protein n=1 Tax=Umbra pygmaea TaxID=75934 RepID=A0ABD0VZ34_UMBPY